MPELPEVETLKGDLSQEIIGKRVREIQIRQGRIFRKNPSREFFKRNLLGKRIVGLKRRGKALIISFDSSKLLVVRLGMTGQITITPELTGPSDRHVHLIMTLEDDSRIFYRDVRRFGQVFLSTLNEVESSLQLGPEPLDDDFHLSHLGKILNSGMRVKTLLMDQRKVAGIGNIYSDEILFTAGISPLRAARSLSYHEVKRLYHAIRKILRDGIRKRGSTIRDFRDGWGRTGSYQQYFRVYQRGGQECRVCKTLIEKVRLGGRNCHFCPSCQN